MLLKEKTIITAIFLSAAFFVAPKIVWAQVIINEVAWMGSSASANDEWMELYNDASPVDLAGWKIIWGADDKYSITLAGQISANGYFLLERTNDDSVPGITADQIYAGALGNSGDYLKLFNAQNSLVSEINASAGWPAGDNAQKLTMERTAGGAWQNSANADGTPKAANSSESSAPTPTPSAAPSSSPAPTATATPSPSATAQTFDYSKDILINEFLPAPSSAGPAPSDGEKEWVELFNAGSAVINLAGWQIDDAENSTSPQVIPANATIYANGFLVISFNKSTLNNEGDKVRLLWPDDQVVHAVSYDKAKPGQSVAKFGASWLWTNQPTPGSANKKSALENNKPAAMATATEKINPLEESVAAPSSPTPNKKTPAPQTIISSTPSPSIASQSITKPENVKLSATIGEPSLGEPTKRSPKASFVLSLDGVILLAGLAASGLIYFRRQKQIDIEGMDD